MNEMSLFISISVKMDYSQILDSTKKGYFCTEWFWWGIRYKWIRDK